MEEKPEDIKRAAHELDYLKNKFIEIVSHELQTPLTEIRVTAGLLLDERLGNLQAPQKAMVESIDDSVKTAISRLHDLITLLEIEQSRVNLHLQPGLISDLMESVYNMELYKAKRKDITITMAPDKLLSPIMMDLEKVRYAIDTMVDNAICYTPKTGKITMSVSETNGFRRLEVRDTGIGIPAAEHSVIFNKFGRASNATVAFPDGAGIALYIAKSYIEKLGGHMGFDSQEGKGSTFWIEIPIKQVGKNE